MTQPDPAPDASVSGARAPETALSPAPVSPAPAGPLSGLLVADFSRVLAGPYCTMLLADLGADVIKVESPGGDDTRQWVPPVNEEGRSTYFLAINRNKRSVALDLRPGRPGRRAGRPGGPTCSCRTSSPAGLARYRAGLRDRQRDESRHRLRLDQRLRRGWRQDLPGYDLMVQAMSGLMSLTGDPGGPPFQPGSRSST
jgi:hypothetical protein